MAAYRVVIVTGGSSGPGRELARQLARRDYAVVVVYLRDQAGADAAVEEIVRSNGTAVAVRADITDELDVERMFAETRAVFGDIDVLVHAAKRDPSIVNRHAASELRRGGAIVSLSSSDTVSPALVRALRARDITVNGLTAGLEPPGADYRPAALLAMLDRWSQAG